MNFAAPNNFNNPSGEDIRHMLERHSTDLRDIMTSSDF